MVGRVALVAQSLTYYAITNRMSSLRDHAYDPTYEPQEGEYCQGYAEIAFHPDASVREHGCHHKCTQDPHDPDCTHSASAQVTMWASDSNFLCAPLATLQELCTMSENCIGVTWAKSNNAGLLSTTECSMETGSAYTFYKKVVDPTPACALGEGREIASTTHIHPEVEGLYELDEDGDSYTQVQPAGNAQIVWDGSHCGWVVQLDMSVAPVVHPPVPGCEDRNDAANAAFQNTVDTADPDICHNVAKVWGDGTYCVHPVFAAVCAKSCGVPCGDSDEAAEAYSELLGQGPATCADLSCDDLIASALCRDTCKGRRLSGRARHAPLLGDQLRRALSDFRLDRLARKQRPGATDREKHRRLNMGGDFETIYYTFEPLAGGCGNTPDHTKLDIDGEATALYDIKSWHVATPLQMALSCPGQQRYVVTSADHFCTRQNIAAPFNSDAAVVNNACYRKCTLLGGTTDADGNLVAKTTNSIDDAGTNDWCAGNSPDFTALTNALCLPREDCEALCDTLDDCVSFDMHKTLPQCYLNFGPCETNGTVSTDFDIVGRVDTPTETTAAVTDLERDSYITYTGLAYGVNVTGYEGTVLTASRTQCEQECSVAHCWGFLYEHLSGQCTLFDVVSDPANPGANVPPMDADGAPDISYGWLDSAAAQHVTSIVWRKPFVPCSVGVVADATLRPLEEAYLGLYEELIDSGLNMGPLATKGTFLRADNRTRLRFFEDGGCDAWWLETNTKPLEEVHLFNCSDEHEAANVFLAQTQPYTTTSTTTLPPAPTTTTSTTTTSTTTTTTSGNNTAAPTPAPTVLPTTPSPTPAPTVAPTVIPFMGEKEHACQWGASEGWCEKSAVFRGACPHTCGAFPAGQAFKVVSYPDKSGYPADYTYQTETRDGDDFACHGDDDAAIPELASMYGLTGATCADVAQGDWYNHTHAPCQFGDLSVLMNAICKTTCASTPDLFPPDEIVTITDESFPEGALYGQRRLFSRGRVLDGITLSFGGRDDAELEIHYLDGLADDAWWTAHFRTYTFGECPDLPTEASGAPAQAAYDAIGDRYPQDHLSNAPSAMFYLATPLDPGTSVARVCRDAPHCPELTSCAMGANRFSDELDAFRGDLDRSDWLSGADEGTRTAVMANFVPKTIMTDTRAEAYVVAAKSEFAGEIYRTVPGATRVKVVSGLADRAIVTVAPATAGAGVFSLAELGRAYTSSEHWGPWTTDVIRIERFDAQGGVADSGSVQFDVWEPAAQLRMFAFGRGEAAGHDLEQLGGHVEALSGGWWRVTAPFAGADFVGTVDLDECAHNNPCDDNAECKNEVGASPACLCKPGYTGSGLRHDCVLEPDAYSARNQNYYFRLQHNDRLDYGWRIQDIEMYQSPDCRSNKISLAAVVVEMPGPAGCPGSACTDETYLTITQQTNVYTGPKAYSHYPGKTDNMYWNGNLFDGNANTEWWSAGLNLNPEVADASQRGAQTIEWIVRGDRNIECVVIKQNANHKSTAMTLTRGPAEGADCGMGPDQERCDPTLAWTEKDTGSLVQFKTQCGEPDTQYFGEILVLEGATTPGGWYGSYANDNRVPSACHCQALCISHVAEGCRSYKYYAAGGVMHCYLQSNIFEQGAGYHGVAKGQWSGWRSGTPGQRTLGFSPSVVASGQEFDLTITGVGLPYSADDNFNTAPRQRIKIVEEHQDCAEQPPEEVAGIGCSETEHKVTTAYGTKSQTVFTICSPRPTSATDEHVTFGPLAITSASENKVYKVCYCPTKCYDPSSYSVVRGRISMASSTFLWSVEPKVVHRKAANGPTHVSVHVHRPSFGSYSNADTWELKLVRDYFGCGVQPDTSKFSCLAARRPGNPTDRHGPKLINPEYEAPGVNDTYLLYPVTDLVVLEFDEGVTTERCSGGFHLISTGGTETIDCSQAVVDNDRVLLSFSTAADGDDFSVRVDAGAVSDLNGNANTEAEYPAVGGKYKFNATGASPDIVFSSVDGGNFNGDTITLYMSRTGISSAGNLTLTECVDNDCHVPGADFAVSATRTDTTVAASVVSNSSAFTYGRRYRLTVLANSIASSDGLTGPQHDKHIEFVIGCGAASYVDSPDSAVWKFDLNLHVDDAGSYTVCFREPGQEFAPIPAQDALTLEIEKLTADKTHPRGIFHNQYFSALAGAIKPLNLTVAGTRVPVPSDSKVVINQDPRGVCGDVSQFRGVRVRPAARDDQVQPTLVGFSPANGATIDPSGGVVLQFSETVRLGQGCYGANGTQPKVTFVDATTPTSQVSFQCGEASVDRERVILNPSSVALTGGVTYYLQVEVGAIEDLAGNSPSFIITDGEYEVAVSASSGDIAPEIVGSYPADGGEGSLAEGTVTLFLSSIGTSNTGSGKLTLTDCGEDFICGTSDDTPAAAFDSNDLTYYTGGGMYHYATVPVGLSLTDGHRFQMSVPANFIKAGTADDNGPNNAHTFEFIKNNAEYSYHDMVLSSTGASSEDALVFGVSLYGAMQSEGQYTLCYCNDQEDTTLADLGDGETTYKLSEDALCESGALASLPEEPLKDRSVAGHQCEAKCALGCTGPYCYCDGFVEGVPSSTLCLPPGLCREACDLSDDCGGINVHHALPQCTLLPASSPCLAPTNATAASAEYTTDEEFMLFTKRSGTACTNLADFQERAGSLFVTTRVEVAVDYVLHPGQDGSIELTTPQYAPGEEPRKPTNLTYEHDPVFNFEATRLLSRDRITVIDCKGTCGVSSPTSAIVLPENGDKIETWNALYPFSWFVDYPHVDAENPVDPATNMEYAMPKRASIGYVEQEGEFCPRANINLDVKVSFDGTLQELRGHQCYTKCSLNAPCEGDDCHCEGHYSGYDALDSNALCADEALCRYMCDQLEECSSIDMHHNGNRCFLNLGSECTGNHNHKYDLHGEDPSYNLLMKSLDPNDSNHGGRRLEPERRLLPASDFGFSWQSMLRFKPLQFKSGGTFKLCFCDSTILDGRGSAACTTEKDYKIEVGTIHASGVSCLIANPSLQRVSCAAQFHGGLRCYRHVEAPEPEPPRIATTALSDDEDELALQYNTKCLYMPQEQADADPDCQGVSAYHGTLGRRAASSHM